MQRSTRLVAAAAVAAGALLATTTPFAAGQQTAPAPTARTAGTPLTARTASSPGAGADTASAGIRSTLHRRGSSTHFPHARPAGPGGAISLSEHGTLTRYGAISHSPRPAVVVHAGVRRLAGTRPGAADTTPPTAAPTPLNSSTRGLKKTWTGLDEAANESAAGYSVEPPDQGLCVGGGKVLELINDSARVYSTDGTPLTPAVSLASVFGLPESFTADTDTYGPSLTDPSCVFDPGSQRFFAVELTLDTDPTTGDLTQANHLDIAVSRTASPLDGFTYYSIPTTDTGGTAGPKHAGCPCLGDYPHLGTDANGLYLTTNEYPWSTAGGVFGNNFNGAQLYAISKRALAAGSATTPFVQFDHNELSTSAGVLPAFTLLPAQAAGRRYDTAQGGTMDLLGSTAASETRPTGFTGRSSSLALWRVTNTASLDSATPALALTGHLMTSEPYAVPPVSGQKAGPTPLRDCLVVSCFGVGSPTLPDAENGLDSSDTRVLAAWYADGKVLGALDTALTVAGNVQAGVAWFAVDPAGPAGAGGPVVSAQGYLGVAHDNVIFPTLATDPAGTGVLGLTLVGDDHFPSAAYTGWRTPGGPTRVSVVRNGRAPADGFCEYSFFNCAGTTTPTSRPRWGDYAAAAFDGDSIYLATEDIASSCSYSTFSADPTCGGTRSYYGNFSTQLSRLGIGGF